MGSTFGVLLIPIELENQQHEKRFFGAGFSGLNKGLSSSRLAVKYDIAK